jgi:hypothetical protein
MSKKIGLIVPEFRRDSVFKPSAVFRIIARKAFRGDEMDFVFGIQVSNNRGMVSEEMWLDGRIHARNICMTIEDARTSTIPCKCSGDDRLSMTAITPVEKMVKDDPENESACQMERYAINQLAKKGKFEIAEFPAGIDDSEIEFSLEYNEHTLLARFKKSSLCDFVN